MSDPISTPIDRSKLISLTAASHLMRGRRGKAPSLFSVRRWCNPRRGWTGPDRVRYVLRSVRLNGEILTTAEWVEDFEDARVNAGMRHAEEMRQAAQAIPLPRERQRAYEAAEKRLDEMLGARGRRRRGQSNGDGD